MNRNDLEKLEKKIGEKTGDIEYRGLLRHRRSLTDVSGGEGKEGVDILGLFNGNGPLRLVLVAFHAGDDLPFRGQVFDQVCLFRVGEALHARVMIS